MPQTPPRQLPLLPKGDYLRQLQTRSDAAILLKLRLKSLQDSPLAFASTWLEESKVSPEAYFHRLMYYTNPPCFGAYGYFNNTDPVGYVLLQHEVLPKLKHRANIYELYVAPVARRKGIGMALMTALIF